MPIQNQAGDISPLLDWGLMKLWKNIRVGKCTVVTFGKFGLPQLFHSIFVFFFVLPHLQIPGSK
jgi:hypothetical protein